MDANHALAALIALPTKKYSFFFTRFSLIFFFPIAFFPSRHWRCIINRTLFLKCLESRCSSPLPEGCGNGNVFRVVRSLHEEYRYEEDKDKIGHGAFSVVYRASPVGRTVAMERTWQTARAAATEDPFHSTLSAQSTVMPNAAAPLFVALKVLPRDIYNEEKAARQRREVQRSGRLVSIRGHKGCTMLSRPCRQSTSPS